MVSQCVAVVPLGITHHFKSLCSNHSAEKIGLAIPLDSKSVSGQIDRAEIFCPSGKVVPLITIRLRPFGGLLAVQCCVTRCLEMGSGWPHPSEDTLFSRSVAKHTRSMTEATSEAFSGFLIDAAAPCRDAITAKSD